MRGMDLGLPNFFWDTLDMYRNHWNGLQAGTLEHPTWPIDTMGLMSISRYFQGYCKNNISCYFSYATVISDDIYLGKIAANFSDNVP